ncbi:MAG: hydroxymethylglutaryl-CoA lyase [Bacteroidota bacterium]
MKIIECPRDAMQGLEEFIPTRKKVDYLNTLLAVGFDTLDFGSFVSPKAIPQMSDTAAVLSGLNLGDSKSKLLAIVANIRGASEAIQFDEIEYLGFPFSISETFQQRNTNKSIVEALNTLDEIQQLCLQRDRQLVCYISMGFGNPYDDPFDPQVVGKFTEILHSLGIHIISLADTIGVAEPNLIKHLFNDLIPSFPDVEFGAHFHSNPATAIEKVSAAYQSGCRRFDGAIRGFGGCPMAKDELVGNIATEDMISYFDSINLDLGIDRDFFNASIQASASIFG